jgi:SAM-dependent methyltransferase
MKKLKQKFAYAIGKRLGARTIRTMLAARINDELSRLYGDFHTDIDFNALAVEIPLNESRVVRGEIVYQLGKLSGHVRNLLLPGEPGISKPNYAQLAGLATGQVVTAGLHDDADHLWNFEMDPPASLAAQRFDCVVSQAILEHLIDPYKHVSDCAGLLDSGGHLLLHTVLPGFIYHRHPVDCMRFFPDWFEEVAKRLGLQVADKSMFDGHIVYLLRKP